MKALPIRFSLHDCSFRGEFRRFVFINGAHRESRENQTAKMPRCIPSCIFLAHLFSGISAPINPSNSF